MSESRLTGYKDKLGNDIKEGDVVLLEGNKHKVVWGLVKDCCVECEAWILEPAVFGQTVYYHMADLEVTGRT